MEILTTIELGEFGVRSEGLCLLLLGNQVYCLGCFSYIINHLKKNNYRSIMLVKIMTNFNHYVRRCGLRDMVYHGPAYT